MITEEEQGLRDRIKAAREKADAKQKAMVDDASRATREARMGRLEGELKAQEARAANVDSASDAAVLPGRIKSSLGASLAPPVAPPAVPAGDVTEGDE